MKLTKRWNYGRHKNLNKYVTFDEILKSWRINFYYSKKKNTTIKIHAKSSPNYAF